MQAISGVCRSNTAYVAPAGPEAGGLKVHVCLQVPAIPSQSQKPPNPPGQHLLNNPGPLLQPVPSFNDDMDMDMS